MSRIGKKPIQIPEGVEIKIEGNRAIVKGPKGELSLEILPGIKVEAREDKIFVSPKKEIFEKKQNSCGAGKKTKAFWGLTQSLLCNMVEGVTAGFEKKLEIHGIGFKAAVEGKELVLYVGFTNPVKIKIPSDLKISVEKNIIIVSGIDKNLVGQTSATIRKAKPPEPYKGKGIRYLGEQVRRKVGKRAATTG